MSKHLLTPAALMLLRDIESYLERSGEKRTVFGLGAVGDGYYLRRLEGGREPRQKTVDRVRKYLAKQEAKAVKDYHGKASHTD